MDIYAPLAGRMGMQWMREELEDLSFRVLNPEGRNSIIRRFITLQRETGDVVQRISADMRVELEKDNIVAEVVGRAKKPFSIWRKMQEKEQGFSRLSDIYGFRIITATEADCYRVLGTIHQRWRAVPGRFKDYISQPKTNGYRSIHTTVSGRDGKRVEVQIRTREMHEVAETGVAAHWSYRNGERVENRFAVDPAKWISALTERFDDAQDHEDFLEAVKLEMYTDQVFCFTPKGEVIKLPRGGTPIDFAYAIHTRIGDACVGAKVDGIRVPLWTRLKNGQSVEIVTAEGQRPQVTWVDIAVTGRAKTAIKRSLREEDRTRFIRLGQELVRVAFENVGRKGTDKALRTAAKTLAYESVDDMLMHLGSAEVSAREVVRSIYPELIEKHGDEIDAGRAVIGLDADQTHKRAACCQPVPGERIVGITYRGHGVVVHAIDCDALADFEDMPERWVDLHWQEGNHRAINTVTFDVSISNDDADLRDADHLHRVTTALEADSSVSSISRLRDPGAAGAGTQREGA